MDQLDLGLAEVESESWPSVKLGVVVDCELEKFKAEEMKVNLLARMFANVSFCV